MQCGVDLLTSQGFAHEVISYCEACEARTVLFISSKKADRTTVVAGKKTPFEANIRMIAFIRAVGKGHSGLQLFSKYLNSPQPMTRRNYAKLFKLQHAAAQYVAINSMTAASAEARDACGRDCCVSVDGTWQRRGHSSHHGVVSAISTDSGKCVDAEVLSNLCKCFPLWPLDRGSLSVPLNIGSLGVPLDRGSLGGLWIEVLLVCLWIEVLLVCLWIEVLLVCLWIEVLLVCLWIEVFTVCF